MTSCIIQCNLMCVCMYMYIVVGISYMYIVVGISYMYIVVGISYMYIWVLVTCTNTTASLVYNLSIFRG